MESEKLKKIRIGICIVVTVLYFAGLVCMLCRNTGLGVLLWGISTVAGMGVLFYVQRLEREKREAEEMEKLEKAEKEAAAKKEE